MEIKSGSIIKKGGKVLYVYGVSTYEDKWALGGTQQDAIGVNLDTGVVDDIQDCKYSNLVYFNELTTKQQLVLACHVSARIALTEGGVITISGKARSGKDTLAREIAMSLGPKKDNRVSRNAIITALGDAIRDIVRVLYGNYEGKRRHDLIMVGQGLREKDTNIWIKTWLRQAIEDLMKYGALFVVPDVRQPNEFTFFKSLGALTVRIDSNEEKRREIIAAVDGEDALDEKLLNDETESHVVNFDADIIVFNEYDETFKKEVEAVIERISDEGEDNE